MAINIAWKFGLSIPSGPQFEIASALAVDACDRIVVMIPNTTASPPAEVSVDIQPGAAGRIRFLLIRSDSYGDNLKFKVHDTGNDEHALNDTLFLIGAGAAGLLESPLDKILVINTLGHDVNLEILVGRLAV